MVKRVAFLLLVAGSFVSCRTIEVLQDPSGARIVEYTFVSADDGGVEVLFSFEQRFRKVIGKSGSEDLRMFFYAVANAYMVLLIDPEMTITIDGKESRLPILNLEYAARRSGGADHKGYIETGIPYLHIRGELDLNNLRAALSKAQSVSLRIRRENKYAVINCTVKETENIRTLIAHDGRE